MSGAFDPYHRWLGIPPKDQPANCYRLLAIDLFESDPDVIRDAAEQRMAHVRTYQLGPNAEVSQKILNELAAAKACLLDPARKAAYDAPLKTPLHAPDMTPVPTDDIYTIAPLVPAPQPPVLPRSRFVEPVQSRERRGVGRWSWAAAGLVAAAVLCGAFVVSSNRRDDQLSTNAMPAATDVRQPDSGTEKGNSPAVPVSRPPKLQTISNATIDAGAMLRFRVALSDPGTLGSAYRFRLGTGAPTGAAIDPRTGVFTWVPYWVQAGEHRITVCVVGDDETDLGDRATFRVTVQRHVVAPAIRRIPRQTVAAGRTNRFTIDLSSPAGSLDKLTFSALDAPSWLSVDSLTGTVTLAPPESEPAGTHSVVVRAAAGGDNEMPAEATFDVTVTRPIAVAAPARPSMFIGPTRSQPAMPSAYFTISLPSGKSLQTNDVDMLANAKSEASSLLAKYKANNPNVVGKFQDGSKSDIAFVTSIKDKKPDGAAVFFHNGQSQPSKYANYRSGQWDGVVATWAETGHKEFWAHYDNGKRHGLVCLFEHDAPKAIFECTKGQLDALHLVAGNQIAKSLSGDDLASASDTLVFNVVAEVDDIERRMKAEDREFRDLVRTAVNLRLGAINEKQRDAARARSNQRNQQRQKVFQDLRRASGMP